MLDDWAVVALHNYLVLLASQEAHCEGSIKVDLQMINHGQSQRHGISARKQIPTKWEQTSFHSVHHTLIWHSGNSVDIVSMSSVLFLFQSYLAAFSARASVGVCFIKAFLVFYLLHHSYFCHFLLFSRFKSILLLLHYLLSLCERYMWMN